MKKYILGSFFIQIIYFFYNNIDIWHSLFEYGNININYLIFVFSIALISHILFLRQKMLKLHTSSKVADNITDIEYIYSEL
jgi:hypothetical protein